MSLTCDAAAPPSLHLPHLMGEPTLAYALRSTQVIRYNTSLCPRNIIRYGCSSRRWNARRGTLHPGRTGDGLCSLSTCEGNCAEQISARHEHGPQAQATPRLRQAWHTWITLLMYNHMRYNRGIRIRPWRTPRAVRGVCLPHCVCRRS